MPNGDEKQLRLREQRAKEAIDLAMQGRWKEAAELNRTIIQDFPGDVEAYNRLGRACIELGEYAQAKEAYGKTAEIDPYNAIAKKNLQRLSHLKETARAEVEQHKVDPQHFIEEIGKAGVVKLFTLGKPEVLATAVAGDSVNLKIKGLTLRVENSRGEYLGEVDPRHAQRLMKLIEGGNKYNASVVSSTEKSMTVIIRETYQDPSLVGRLSFPPRDLEEVRPYASDRMLKIEAEEDEDDSGYTVVGGEEVEVLAQERPEADDDASGN